DRSRHESQARTRAEQGREGREAGGPRGAIGEGRESGEAREDGEGREDGEAREAGQGRATWALTFTEQGDEGDAIRVHGDQRDRASDIYLTRNGGGERAPLVVLHFRQRLGR